MQRAVLTLSGVKVQRSVFRLYRGKKKKSCSDFPENGSKLFVYLREFRKRIVCTTSDVSVISLQIKMSQVNILPIPYMAINLYCIISR